MTHSLHAGPRGRPQCRMWLRSPRSPDQRTLTHIRRVRPAVNGQAARVGCWTGRGKRHAAEFSKLQTRYLIGRLSRIVTVSDPRLQNLLVNISCTAATQIV